MSAPSTSDRLDLLTAIHQLEARVRPVAEVETIPVAEAQGRVLAEPAIAPLSLPPFAASAMDGYAFQHETCSGLCLRSGPTSGFPGTTFRQGSSCSQCSVVSHPSTSAF